MTPRRDSTLASFLRAARTEAPPPGARARALDRALAPTSLERLACAHGGPAVLLVAAAAFAALLVAGPAPDRPGSATSGCAEGVEAPPGACLAAETRSAAVALEQGSSSSSSSSSSGSARRWGGG